MRSLARFHLYRSHIGIAVLKYLTTFRIAHILSGLVYLGLVRHIFRGGKRQEVCKCHPTEAETAVSLLLRISCIHPSVAKLDREKEETANESDGQRKT